MAPVHPHPDDDQPRQEADLLLQHAGQGGDRDEGQARQGERVKPVGQDLVGIPNSEILTSLQKFCHL